MKLKRFLALAVSLAMVLSIVPAFSLTASAAETVLFDVDTITGSGEQNLSVAGWTATENGAAIRWNQNWGAEATGVWGSTGTYALMFFFTNSRGSSNGNATATINSAANTAGATKVNINFNFACQTAADLYQRWWFKDVDGNSFASFYFDKNVKAEVGMDTITQVAASGSDVLAMRGTNIDITAEKNAEGTYTVTYKIAGEVVATETVDNVNGFGSVYADVPSWNQQYAAAGLQDLVITYELPETSKTVVATYTLNGETVGTVSKTYDTATATGVEFPQYVAPCANGTNVLYAAAATTLSDDATIELEAVANAGTYAVGDVFASSGVQYEVKSANLIPNGDFAYGTTGWYASNGSVASFFTSNGDGTMTLTAGGTGVGGANSLYRAWAIETGKKYIFTFYTDNANEYHKVSVTDSLASNDTGNTFLNLGGTNNGSVQGTNSVIFDATTAYVMLNFRWLGTGNVFGNFGLYEIAEAEVAVEETVASMAAIAPVKVIGDTAVVLPATVAVTGSLGSEINAPIVWDAPASYEVGETTVNGVATVQFGEQEATTAEVSTTVTVLEETFTIESFTSVNGQDAAKASQKAFPVALTGEFSIEFNANYASFGDLFITIKTADAGFFGPEQIALGHQASGAFRPVNGNGSGGRAAADSTIATLSTGVDYRFFITTDASTDKYTVTVYDVATGVEVVTAENFGYRTNSEAIEVITALTNNGQGEVTLSNIKVNAPGVSKTEYTINITMDGETNTTTASFWSEAEALASIADVTGYEKTVTVEGTTINVVYTATQTLAATFIDANENVIKAVSEVVAIGETYTVAAEEIFFLDGDYNGYFYQIPETVLSADNNNVVVTVTETPNKYAVMEDMLVSDNEVWGMRATNNNSVFVAAGADANRGPVVDANGENAHDANHTPSTLGKSRVGFMQFPVVDVVEGQKVTANFYVREWHGNGFSNSNQTLRLAAYAVNDSSWVALSDGGSYDSANAPIFEGYTNPVFSQVCYNNVGYIAFDITEMMMAAKAAGLETITLRLNAPYGAAYIAEREACVVGGAYAGNAAYVLVEDANLVKVTETGAATLTKNGSDVNGVAYVAATDDVRLTASGAVVVGTDAGYYYANTTMSITEATAFENTVPAALGLAMVSGAQVRIGTTELEDGAKLDALADSGIRFLATANYTDTVLNDADEFGIKVTAEASDKATYVPAVKFQDADETVFTAAITGLAESNYNRNFTAVGYAKVTMADGSVAELTTDSVTRSVYQVSAGIMKNGSADADNAAYTVDGVVKNILNAYVNQTGIRLTYTADGITVEDGKYTGDVFFTVESTVNEDGSVAVTITPDTTWGTPAEIAEWWTDYVRVNNNNSVAKTYISDAAVVDGVLTFTFTVPAAE